MVIKKYNEKIANTLVVEQPKPKGHGLAYKFIKYSVLVAAIGGSSYYLRKEIKTNPEFL